MLTDPVHIEPHLIGEFDLFEQIAHALRDHVRVGRGARIGLAKGVDAQFHVCAQSRKCVNAKFLMEKCVICHKSMRLAFADLVIRGYVPAWITAPK